MCLRVLIACLRCRSPSGRSCRSPLRAPRAHERRSGSRRHAREDRLARRAPSASSRPTSRLRRGASRAPEPDRARCRPPGHASRPTSTPSGPSSSASRARCATSAPRLTRLRAADRDAPRARHAARRDVQGRQARRPDAWSSTPTGSPTCSSAASSSRRIADQDRKIVTIVRDAKRRRRRDRDAARRARAPPAAVTASRRSARNEVAEVKSELIGTRVGYERTQAGKQRRARRRCAATATALEEHLEAIEAEQAKIRARS